MPNELPSRSRELETFMEAILDRLEAAAAEF
jgi:hypothetical protein